MTVTVLGIDPSLTATGIASTRGWCELVGQEGITKLPIVDRIAAIDALVDGIATLWRGRPDLVVVEQPAFSRSGGGSVERHALYWLLLRNLRRAELPFADVTATSRMRYATGKGKALKTAVVDAVARRFPQYETGGNDNLADAIVLAAMGADHLGQPLTPMPATHRIALDGVQWPDQEVAR